MSYEDAMRITEVSWNPQTNKYTTIQKGDYRDMPLSKLPIAKKLYRAIMEKRSFSNLGSTVSTAIRWEGDYYIISFAPFWQKDFVLDIAVGEQGKLPFMFRSPFTGDPTTGELHYNWKDETQKATPAECYSWNHSQSIVSRLADLGFIIQRGKTSVGRALNEKTGRMNNIYANVPQIEIYDVLIEPPEVGTNNWELVHNRDNPHSVWIPLFKFAWYFRNGNLALDSQDKTIKL